MWSKKIALSVALFIVAGSFQIIGVQSVFASVVFSTTADPNLSESSWISPSLIDVATSTTLYIQYCFTSDILTSGDFTANIIISPSTVYMPNGTSMSPRSAGYQCRISTGVLSKALVAGQNYSFVIANNTGRTMQNPYGSVQSVIFATTLEDIVLDITTHIISVVPLNGSTTGFTTQVGASGYVSSDDFVEGTKLSINLVNNTIQNGVGGSALDAWNSVVPDYEFPIDSSGFFSFSTSTEFNIDGQVNMSSRIIVPNDTFLIGFLLPDEILLSTTTVFYVNHPTGLDIAMASTTDVLVSALIMGTTTQSIIRCNPSDFDITTCLISLIVPPSYVFSNAYTRLKQDALTHFPLGYITNFISILVNTASSSLPVISGTVPQGIPGAGTSFSLSLNHVLDPILYEDIRPYVDSDDTLYDITYPYWATLIYILTGLYLIGRILGFGVIPNDFKTTESGSETVVSRGITKNGNKKTLTHTIRKTRGIKKI